jgi:aromatic-L-amino-acid/L-tryptophan decarboxylase
MSHAATQLQLGSFSARMHEFDELTSRIADAVYRYTDWRLRLDPVPLDSGESWEDLKARIDGLLGADGNDPEKVLEIYDEAISRAVISCDSPRFFAFIPAAPTKAALLFDMVVSCASLQGISWLEAAGAVAAENQVLRLIADLAGLPESAGGCFVSGGSAGNLSALVVARETAKLRRAEAGQDQPARWRLAVSDQAHSSIRNALRIIEVDALIVPTDDHRLTGEELWAALASDGDPSSVCGVVATCGTTNAGIIDDLAGVADVAREHGLWMHVDGAYGGAGLLAPSVRDRYAGIEHADSFVVDPHKWLFAPFDCAALIYREPALARAVHTQDASYLDVIHERADWNPSDYAYHLTRRARGLPLWFSLAVHGTDAYRHVIERALALTREVAELIRSATHLELVREPELAVVLFRRQGWTSAQYHAWADELLDEQVAFVAPSTWEGETVGRFVFMHPKTTIDMVCQLLNRME